MTPHKIILFIFSYNNIYFLSIFFINLFYSYGETFSECFPNKYHFVCKNPIAFLRSIGIDIDDNFISLSNLQLIETKSTGFSVSGVYVDSNHKIYFVKDANPFNELLGSKLMNLIVGTASTPIVKIVKDKPHTVASLKLPNFKMHNTAGPQDNIIGLTLLTVAMDWLGIVDRHGQNIGYIQSNSKTLLAARVDFDNSFSFEGSVTSTQGYSTQNDHLNLQQLYLTMQCHPNDQITSAINHIANISDEAIIMIIFQTWLTLSQTESTTSLSECFELARKLIERKQAFYQTLQINSKKDDKQLISLFN